MNYCKFLIIIFLCGFLKNYSQNTYVVTTTNDPVDPFLTVSGELRWAITQANLTPGIDNIVFNIAGSPPHTINLQSSLPNVTDGIIMDGNTQPPFGPLANGDKKIHIVANNTILNVLVLDRSVASKPASIVKNIVFANSAWAVVNLFGSIGNHIFNDNIVYKTFFVAGMPLMNTQSNNTIKGNIVGTDHTFSTNGIFANHCCLNLDAICMGSNTVGSLLAGEKNYFYNTSSGGIGSVHVNQGNENKISGNIYINSSNNIALYSNSGSCLSNHARGKPAFSVSIMNPVTYIQGTTLPNDLVELYKSNAGGIDAVSLLGTVTANSSGAFNTTVSGLVPGDKVIAIGTDPQNNTSEFASPCLSIGSLTITGSNCTGTNKTYTYKVIDNTGNYPGIQGTYTLNFGDGTPSNTGTIAGNVAYTDNHTYLLAGPHTVSFIFQPTTSTCPAITYTTPLVAISCTQTVSCTSIDSVVITPVVTSSCTSIDVTANITNNNTNYTPTYKWNFGDGSPWITGTLPPPQQTISTNYTYLSPGTYTITFILTGPSDCGFAIKKTVITVTCTPTIACTSINSVVITPIVTNSCTVITVTANITNTNSNYTPTYTWDFGDGSPSVTGTLPPPQQTTNTNHTYLSTGTYTVTFILTGPSDCGGTSKEVVITVTCTPPPPPPCTDCIGSFNPSPGDTLIISTWVKEQNALATKVNYNNPKLSIEYPSTTAVPSGPFFAKGQIIDGWQRIEEQFIIPTTAFYLKIKLECVTGDCLFDDVRVFPKNGSMKSYVYDPQTMRLVAELDERNYATMYEYDEEGKLTRIKKETERGIMTIQENKSSNSKK